jgi:hypothetical protein
MPAAYLFCPIGDANILKPFTLSGYFRHDFVRLIFRHPGAFAMAAVHFLVRFMIEDI